MDEYAAGRTPNPCLRCNEKIKFAAVLDRALALGFDAVATGHYAQIRNAPDGTAELHRAVDAGKDQSYVLGVLTQEQLAHSLFPLGDTAKPRRAGRGGSPRAARRRQAGLPRHLLRRRRRQRRLAARQARRPRAQPRGSDRRQHLAAPRSAGTTGTFGFTIGQRKGPPARGPGARRQAALRPRHRAGLRHGHRRTTRGAHRRPDHRRPASLVRCDADSAARRHRPAARPRERAPRPGDRLRRRGHHRAGRPGPGDRPRPGRRRSTTAPASSGPPRSSPPRAPAYPRERRLRRRVVARRRRGVLRRGAADRARRGTRTCPTSPRCPGRGAPAAMIGRTLATVTDLGFDLQPAGWRLTDARRHRPAPRPLAAGPRPRPARGAGAGPPRHVQDPGRRALDAGERRREAAG